MNQQHSSRRTFLKTSSRAAAGWYLLPFFLEACKKKDFLADSDFKGSVAIIGAGPAGLYAAHLLQQRGIAVSIFEANNRIGGRIKPLFDFASFPIELGAEEVHGNNSAFYQLAALSPNGLQEETGTDYYELDGAIRSESAASADPDFAAVSQLFDEVIDFSGSDINAFAFGNLNTISPRVEHIWNAWMGNEQGTANVRLSMQGIQQQEELWSAGDANYFFTQGDMLSALLNAMPGVELLVRLNTPIVQVNYTGNKVKLTAEDGTQFEADKCIVTAPLPVLFNNAINFTPALPTLHRQAINSLGMDTGLKVILKFSQAFWPSDMASLYTAGYAPEYWVTSKGRSTTDFILTAFVNGDKASILASEGDAAVDLLLADLDALFSNQASAFYLDAHIENWANEPWIGGAYSYPKVDSGNIRVQLTEPLGNKVFIAGEATHAQGHFATVHGAMETALRAVTQLLEV